MGHAQGSGAACWLEAAAWLSLHMLFDAVSENLLTGVDAVTHIAGGAHCCRTSCWTWAAARTSTSAALLARAGPSLPSAWRPLCIASPSVSGITCCSVAKWRILMRQKSYYTLRGSAAYHAADAGWLRARPSHRTRTVTRQQAPGWAAGF